MPESTGRGREHSPDSPKQGRTYQDREGKKVKNREEMRVMKETVKQFRILCRDYGISLDSNEIYRAAAGRKTGRSHRRRALSIVPDQQEEEESSSSSGDELMSADGENEGLGNHARWEEIKELLGDLQTRKRLRAVKEISRSLQDSAERAEIELKELDALEGKGNSTEEKQSGEEQPKLAREDTFEDLASPTAQDLGFEVDEQLLNFKASDMEVVKALHRCVDFVPELKQRVMKKAAMRKSLLGEMEAQELEEALETQNDAAADDVDIVVEETGIIHEVNRKLHRFGDLKRDAPHDLAIVLEAQRAEIRAVAARIDEGERRVKTQRLALDYIDNNVETNNVDPELLRSAITATQDMRARILKTRREEEERRMRSERLARNMPSEVEVQDCMDECEKLRMESDRATERVERLLEFTASAASAERQSIILNPEVAAAQELSLTNTDNGGDGDESPPPPDVPSSGLEIKIPPSNDMKSSTPLSPAVSPSMVTPGGRRRAVQATVQPVPALEVSHEKAPQLHTQLKAEVAKLEGEIQEQQLRISNCEVTMRNAEQTLKVLEETKTLFLEQIAREKPSLLGDLGLVGSDDADEQDFNPTESDEDMNGGADGDLLPSKDMEATLKTLDGEEQWLRMELDMLSAQFEEETTTAQAEALKTLMPERLPTPGGPDDFASEFHWAEEETFADVRKLAVRVEMHIKNLQTEQNDNTDEDADDDDRESSSSSLSMSRHGSMAEDAAAAKRLASRHSEVQKLLQLRHQNAKLLMNIKEAQEELRDLRESSGAPGVSGPEEYNAEDSVKYAEVQRKQRELLALRKRWWSERQDPQTTVRRARAVAELPLQTVQAGMKPNPNLTEDKPVNVETSLFQRIYSSMTTP